MDSEQYRHAALASLRIKQNELVDDAMEAMAALHSFRIDHEEILERALVHGEDQKALMDAVFDAPPSDPELLLKNHEELHLQLKKAANNVRLLMSYTRLDNIHRQAEAISEDSTEL